jgi:hypothetical protein
MLPDLRSPSAEKPELPSRRTIESDRLLGLFGQPLAQSLDAFAVDAEIRVAQA